MIHTIEEYSLNAWPCLQQILYDGWILRFANGYTKRANSVNPIYSGAQDVDQKIQRCRQIYLAQNLPSIFRITPLADPPNLDNLLAELGFSKQSVTSVQTLDLTACPTVETTAFQFWPEFSPEWGQIFSGLNGHLEQQRVKHQAILRQIVPEKCFAVLANQGQIIACGLGVLEADHLGLFDILTAPGERRKGWGRELMLNILHWGKKKGAKKAYLGVEMANEPALNFYQKLGFAEVYRYWYRIKKIEAGEGQQ
ncbi:MAG: GNAT family N-acetyltransferase [Anaerolineae bacterium]|nr:GNAT family N-acetyltransferase [Anaerolineae bacterium]